MGGGNKESEEERWKTERMQEEGYRNKHKETEMERDRKKDGKTDIQRQWMHTYPVRI